jgi:hypothetical protein
MCETRREFRNARLNYKDTNNDSNVNVSRRGEGPRRDVEWTEIVNNKKNVDNEKVKGEKIPLKRGRKPKQVVSESFVA